MNKTPKILPWLARKAGVSGEKAAALWQQAVSDASLQAEPAKDPDRYYRLLIDRLHELLKLEKPVRKPTASHNTSPLLVLGLHGGKSAAVLLNPCTMASLPS